MTRHPALAALSRHHSDALAEARRLRLEAGGARPASAAEEFLRFFARESVRHLREEEESVFPLAVGLDEAREPLVRALLEHQRLRALAASLEASVCRGDRGLSASMRELADALVAHVESEERELFPLLERLVGDCVLTQHRPHGRAAGGPVWGAECEELNATVLEWGPGAGPPEHVNDERDVIMGIFEGSAVVTLDGVERRLDPGEAIVIEKGRARRITAGSAGVRYLTVHRRRPPLQIFRPERATRGS